MIVINCFTGKKIPVNEMTLYPKRLKKHSLLEIERIKASIIEDGLCFPITIGKVNGVNYIIDGECTYLALQELNCEDEIPVVIIKCTEETIKKYIIMSASTNHCIFKPSIESFVKDTNINVKNFAFPEGTLIDFFDLNDIDRYFESIPNTNKCMQENYVGLLADD